MGSWHSWFKCLQGGERCFERTALWATARKLLLPKMAKQLVSGSEICQDWGLWSLILVSARQKQFHKLNTFVRDGLSVPQAQTHLAALAGRLCLQRWRIVGLELEGEEQQSYWTKALSHVHARVFQLRGSSEAGDCAFLKGKLLSVRFPVVFCWGYHSGVSLHSCSSWRTEWKLFIPFWTTYVQLS